MLCRRDVGDFSVRYSEYVNHKKENAVQIDIPDTRILVVDDVDMNIQVVKGLLKRTHAEIDTAYSGRECLEKTAEKQYDIILLDHMMPEMDGIETFERLKQQKGPNTGTPVIVLTANAIVGAREEYLQFGFDDYLSKPIMEADLLRVIAAHTRPELAKWIVAEPEAPGDDDANWLEKLTFLDTKSALLFCANNPDFYREMLLSFVSENRMGQIQSCFAQENWKNYTVQVHALKSTAKIIGAKELAARALELEMAGKREDVNELRRKHGPCMICYGELRQKLSVLLLR